MKPGNVVQHNITLMKTTNRCGFAIHKRLHAQADAIDSAAVENFHYWLGKRTGSAFYGYLGISLYLEILPNSDKDAFYLCYIQNSWSTATEINGINRALDGPAHLFCGLLSAGDFIAQADDIFFEYRARENARGEVAVSTFGTAKRNRNVQSKRHLYDYQLLALCCQLSD